MKKRILALTMAIISAISTMGLCSCGETDTNKDDTQSKSSAETNIVQTAAPAIQITGTTADENSQGEESSETQQESKAEKEISSDENAQKVYDAVTNYRTQMAERSTPIDGNLNFEFALSDAAGTTDDPKMSPEETIASLAKNTLGDNGNGCTVYAGLSGDTLFIQIKDADGNISQYPQPSGEISWGTFAG